MTWQILALTIYGTKKNGKIYNPLTRKQPDNFGRAAMKIISNINVPETIEEAKTMTYQQLKEACKVFNNHGLSGEDIQKAWDKNWWDGFNTAMNLVYEVLNGCDFTLAYVIADIISLIEDEEEIYKKDGE